MLLPSTVGCQLTLYLVGIRTTVYGGTGPVTGVPRSRSLSALCALLEMLGLDLRPTVVYYLYLLAFRLFIPTLIVISC